jgi:hypothetical protein
MPRKAPPVWPKGTRPPNSGRKKGVPNRITVEAKQLVAQLVNDVAYQHKLRDDFRRRKVPPAVEVLIWNYHLGKPPQTIEMNGTLEMSARIEEERRIFAQLDITDLEQLARESQSLVDRALMLSRARIAAGSRPQPDVIEPNPPRKSP